MKSKNKRNKVLLKSRLNNWEENYSWCKVRTEGLKVKLIDLVTNLLIDLKTKILWMKEKPKISKRSLKS